jgi:DNA polymerase elongation subunit (family B)
MYALSCSTSLSRKILLDTTEIADQNGFEFLHGIADSVATGNENLDLDKPFI